jgi:hypothetical protein
VRRVLITFVIGLALLVAAFFATIAIMNSTVYSAHGFVSSYLDALARHDATTARSLAGVRAPTGVSTTLLTDGALGTIAHVRLVHDTAGGDDIHSVEYSYTLGGRAETSSYSVVRAAPFLGLFARWSFAKSPLATVSVATPHDPRFRANGTSVTSTVPRTESQAYEVFTPGLYVFDHRSTYLVASPVSVPVTEPGSVTPVRVEAEADPLFVTEVRKELAKYYVTCAKQTVLLPTSCPFGKSFSNRVVSTPAWSMASDPAVTIVADGTTGKWLVPSSSGNAHLVVKVQSLYDGSISTFDANVPFTVSYSIAVAADDHLTITSLDAN